MKIQVITGVNDVQQDAYGERMVSAAEMPKAFKYKTIYKNGESVKYKLTMKEVFEKSSVLVNIDMAFGFGLIKDNSVDAIITDPPYNTSYWLKYRDNFEGDMFSRTVETFIKHSHRTLKEDGVLAMFCDYAEYATFISVIEAVFGKDNILFILTPRLANGSNKTNSRKNYNYLIIACKDKEKYLKKMGVNHQDELFFYERTNPKLNNAQSLSSDGVGQLVSYDTTTRYLKDNFIDGDGKTLKDITNSASRENIKAVFSDDDIEEFGGDKKFQDLLNGMFPKNEGIMSYIIEALTLEGERVLDPFSGTGTTGAVCARMGRYFTGFERNYYANVSARRIEKNSLVKTIKDNYEKLICTHRPDVDFYYLEVANKGLNLVNYVGELDPLAYKDKRTQLKVALERNARIIEFIKANILIDSIPELKVTATISSKHLVPILALTIRGTQEEIVHHLREFKRWMYSVIRVEEMYYTSDDTDNLEVISPLTPDYDTFYHFVLPNGEFKNLISEEEFDEKYEEDIPLSVEDIYDGKLLQTHSDVLLPQLNAEAKNIEDLVSERLGFKGFEDKKIPESVTQVTRERANKEMRRIIPLNGNGCVSDNYNPIDKDAMTFFERDLCYMPATQQLLYMSKLKLGARQDLVIIDADKWDSGDMKYLNNSETGAFFGKGMCGKNTNIVVIKKMTAYDNYFYSEISTRLQEIFPNHNHNDFIIKGVDGNDDVIVKIYGDNKRFELNDSKRKERAITDSYVVEPIKLLLEKDGKGVKLPEDVEPNDLGKYHEITIDSLLAKRSIKENGYDLFYKVFRGDKTTIYRPVYADEIKEYKAPLCFDIDRTYKTYDDIIDFTVKLSRGAEDKDLLNVLHIGKNDDVIQSVLKINNTKLICIGDYAKENKSYFDKFGREYLSLKPATFMIEGMRADFEDEVFKEKINSSIGGMFHHNSKEKVKTFEELKKESTVGRTLKYPFEPYFYKSRQKRRDYRGELVGRNNFINPAPVVLPDNKGRVLDYILHKYTDKSKQYKYFYGIDPEKDSKVAMVQKLGAAVDPSLDDAEKRKETIKSNKYLLDLLLKDMV